MVTESGQWVYLLVFVCSHTIFNTPVISVKCLCYIRRTQRWKRSQSGFTLLQYTQIFRWWNIRGFLLQISSVFGTLLIFQRDNEWGKIIARCTRTAIIFHRHESRRVLSLYILASPLLGDELVLSAVCNNIDDHVYPDSWQRDTKKLQYMMCGNKSFSFYLSL